MANNYNKSFNFKNGLQVDDDNFIVNPNGLVGIGTSIPNELLDVRGNVKVSGFVTASNIFATNIYISGTPSYNSLNIGNISIASGVVTATTGLVTYYGDGSKLSNIPTSYWTLSGSTIYSTRNVGVNTTNPAFSLQIGPNPLIFPTGIGINSSGNVYSNGIVTATSFSGSGENLTFLNASNITSGTLSTSFFPSSIRLSGIVTASSFSGSGAQLSSLNASNITSGTISTAYFPSNIGISGTVTAAKFVGDLTGTATTALNLSVTGSINLGSVNSGLASIGVATVTNALYVVGFPAKIGVGTTSVPQSDIEVRKSGISSISVVSDNNIALIGIGRSAEIRTGNTNTYYSYSTRDSLDILNSSAGNVNCYLDYGTAGVNTGSFHWIYGQIPYSPLMSLTYGGNLGLGITNPSTRLYVVGNSYFTGITTVNSNLNVSNTLTVSGNLVVNGSVTGDFGFGNSYYTPENTGAVQRQVKNKLSESTIISINDFGGVGNGVFNNITAFNLAAAASTASNISTTTSIGIVQIPSGNYFIGTTNFKHPVTGTGQISVAGTAATVSVSGLYVGFDVIGGSIVSQPTVWAPQANGLNKPPGNYPSYYNVILAPGCNVSPSTDSQAWRSTIIGSLAGTAVNTWERVEAIGNGAMRFSPLAERVTAIGSLTYQWLGAPDQQYLIDTLHDFWKNSPTGKVPGDPGWDAFDFSSRNPGIGTWINNVGSGLPGYPDYATSTADCSQNIAIGRDAALHTVTDTDSVYIGYQAGTHTFVVQYNTAVGTRALRDGVKLTGCTALGRSAGYWNQEGSDNVFIGHQAGKSLVKGSNNIFIGAFSGDNISSITSNKFVVQSGADTQPLLSGQFDTGFLGISGITTAEALLHVGLTKVAGRTWSPSSAVMGVFENNTTSVVSIISPNTSTGRIDFGDRDSQFMGRIAYDHSDNSMTIVTNDAASITIGSTGAVRFNRISTTASSANAFLDANKSILVSTSSSIYKKDIETLESWRADEVIEKARPVWYRSKASADNPDWGWYGLIAEEVAEIDPRLVHWAYQDDQYEEVIKVTEDGLEEKELKLKEGSQKRPNGVQYDRLGVMLLDVVKRQKETINDLEKRLAALEARLTGS